MDGYLNETSKEETNEKTWDSFLEHFEAKIIIHFCCQTRNLIVINVQKPLDWDDGSCKDIGFAKTQPASSVHDLLSPLRIHAIKT